VVEDERSTTMKLDSVTRKRRRLARSVELAAVPERRFIGRGPLYLVRPSVAIACAPSLRAIAAALRDETLIVAADQLQAVEKFVSDGADSPLFADDATAALREAVRLQHDVVGTAAAIPDHERTTVAA
jgi:hypothetical protein